MAQDIRVTFRPGPSRRAFLGFSFGLAGVATIAACDTGDPGTGGGGEPVDLEGKDVGAMPDYDADMQFTATEPFELSILWTDWPELPIRDSWRIFDHIAELTNVTLTRNQVPFSDSADRRNLLISAGDAPTIIPLTYTGDEKPFVAGGAILPMSDYLDHMPNFRKYAAEWELEEMLERLRQSDGKYYMLPGLQEVSIPVFTLIIRKDAFDEVGVETPQTWDELREALVLIKEQYPDSMPLADGFEGQSMLNYASHAWGTKAGWGFGDGVLDDGAGGLEYAGTSEGYRQMLEFFRGLVDDGLLDPESFTTADAGGGAATITEKIANNRIFAASGASGTVIEFSQALAETMDADSFEFVQIAPLGGPAGQQIEPRNFWHGFMLNADIAETPNFLATLQFLDWLYYSPQAREMLLWGIEGETYTRDGDTFQLAEDISADLWNLNVEGETDLQTDLGFATFLSESTESRVLKESYSSARFVEYIDSVLSTRTPREPYPMAPLEEMELEQAAILSTPIRDTVDQNTLQFILGRRDLSEWDDYVAEVKAQGLDSYMELIQTAYDRFQEQNG